MSKWNRTFLADLGERTASTAGYGAITMLTADASGAISGNPQQWWLVVGLPTALCVLKGLLANMSAPASGASLLAAPPAVNVNEIPDDPAEG